MAWYRYGNVKYREVNVKYSGVWFSNALFCSVIVLYGSVQVRCSKVLFRYGKEKFRNVKVQCCGVECCFVR